jgi:hypothetical protein
VSTSVPTTTRSVNVLVGYVLGAVYLLVGLLGFAVTSGVGFAATDGRSLLGFEVNPLHNIVHLGVGAALVLAARQGLRASRAVNTAVGAVYLLVGVLGLFVMNHGANILALNGADNVLHFGSAALLLGVGLAADKR